MGSNFIWNRTPRGMIRVETDESGFPYLSWLIRNAIIYIYRPVSARVACLLA